MKEKKQKIYDSLDKSVEEQAKETEKISAVSALGLESKKTDDTTDEQLLAEVKKKLDEKYGALERKATEDSAKKRFDLSESIKKAESQAKQQTAQVLDSYGKAVGAVENDALKRGIARSSIANGGIAALEKSKEEAVTRINEKKTDEQKKLADEINGLKEKLDGLLSEYGSQRAAEEETQFATAKKQRDDYNNDVLEYNNDVKQREHEYADDLYQKEGAEYLKKVEDKYKIARLNEVVDFYRSFGDKSVALDDFMNDPRWANYLGEYYDIAFKLIYNGN